MFNGVRNELVFLRENGATKTYGEGDHRYYRWRTFIPTDFMDPPANTACPSGTNAPNAFQVLLQFHDDGECASGGGQGHVPLIFGLIRTTTCGENTGNKYRFNLTVDSDYGPSDTSDSLSDLRVFAATTEITKGKWYDIVLHVKWSATACNNGSPCTWGDPNGGIVELWIDGVRNAAVARPTLATWPTTATCGLDSDQYPHNAGLPMVNHLKTGIYLDKAMLNHKSSVVLDDLIVGTSCTSVWPGGCPR